MSNILHDVQAKKSIARDSRTSMGFGLVPAERGGIIVDLWLMPSRRECLRAAAQVIVLSSC